MTKMYLNFYVFLMFVSLFFVDKFILQSEYFKNALLEWYHMFH